jgi:hypothetical protein
MHCAVKTSPKPNQPQRGGGGNGRRLLCVVIGILFSEGVNETMMGG